MKMLKSHNFYKNCWIKNHPTKYDSYGPTTLDELHLQSEAGRTNKQTYRNTKKLYALILSHTGHKKNNC